MRLRAVPTILAFLLTFPATAGAVAGGGSSGFRGGGGGFSGGGGGFRGGGGTRGGGGFVGGGNGSGAGVGGFLWLIGLGVLAFVAVAIYGALKTRRARRERAARDRDVRSAAAIAAEDDEAFDAECCVADARELFRKIQAAWTARDRTRLAQLVGPDLLEEWFRRLDDFDARGWHNAVTVMPDTPIGVSLAGLVNRDRDEDDRVVVFISTHVQDVVIDATGDRLARTGSQSAVVGVAEYWTLAKREGRWILVSVEQAAEGGHQLSSDLVTTPWEDGRVAQDALIETAEADRPPEQFTTAELADLDFDGEARAAALDLSLADPRFAPDVLETAARRMVAAWTEAVDGSDAELALVATPDAVRELLYADPGQETRVVVRGPSVGYIEIAALDAAAKPPTISIEVALQGVRYVEDRASAAVLEGSREKPRTFTERWDVALDPDGEVLWRITGRSAAGRAAA